MEKDAYGAGTRTPLVTEPTRPFTALLVTCVASFLTPFMGAATTVALPAISRDFSLDAVQMSWVNMAYSLSAAAFLVPLGKVADMVGRGRIFTWGLVVYTVSSLACGFAPGGGLLLVARAVQGLGGAMGFATGIAILASVFPPERRGRVLGINVAVVYTGLASGPVLGGLLTQTLGWRMIFLGVAPLSLGAAVLAATRLRGERGGTRDERFDVPGSVLYALALTAFIYGFTKVQWVWGIGLLAVGSLGLGAFVWWEKARAEHPVLHMGLFFENRVFAFSNLAAFINYSATSAVVFLLSLYLQYIKGLSPSAAGAVMVSQPVVMAVLSPVAGRLSDRIEGRWLASAGMTLTVVGLISLSFLSAQTSVSVVLFALIFMGLGFALFSSPNTNTIMSSVTFRFLGVASATLGTMRLAGQMMSIAITVLILDVMVGPTTITEQNHPDFLAAARVSFIVFAVLCVVGVLASLARGPRQNAGRAS
jgi:EmrB/QacA subfamily drug resistance transporter